ncbi:MAG TPA: DUF177 domain-containing protein [Burkholderiaceae bacterium]|nr:DUF177 domain-containing protein [Burkholderiaceae bacterium]
MKQRQFDPLKLDVEAFARDAAELQGEWSMVDLPRLAESASEESPAAAWPPLRWAARGERLTPRAAEPQTWLHLEAEATVSLVCQRCLQAYAQPLSVQRSLRFVRDEDLAAQLDADSDDDVLAMSRSLDLRELIEDELLLELPLVPRHEECPEPLVHADEDLPEPAEDDKPNPFAALAALKGKGRQQ